MKKPSRPVAPDTQLPIVVFKLGHREVALPQNCIRRIIQTPSALDINEEGYGLMLWEGQTVTLVDLNRLASVPSATIPFLVLFQSTTGPLFGIPVAEIPYLMEIPLTTIQPIPALYRETDPWQISDYIAILDQEDGPVTIYLIDLRHFPPKPAKGSLSLESPERLDRILT